MIDTIFSEFVEQTPVTVMVRGIMERIFEPKALNRLFETYAVKVISKKDHTHLHRSNSEYWLLPCGYNDCWKSPKQYTRELLFSNVVSLMSLVVSGIHPHVSTFRLLQ